MATFTATESKLAEILLKRVIQEFSNHGCNDFNLLEAGFTPEESLEIRRGMAARSSEFSEIFEENRHQVMDVSLLYYLLARIREAASS